MRRALLAFTVVVSVSVGGAVPAAAHAEVREADPPVQGTTAVGVDEVTITFITMDPEVPPTIEVLDPEGNSTTTGQPTVVAEGAGGVTVAVPVVPLEEGRHVVLWEAMSTDGDGLSTGDYEFVVEETSGSSPGVWLLWVVALAIPAAILLRPKRSRRNASET